MGICCVGLPIDPCDGDGADDCGVDGCGWVANHLHHVHHDYVRGCCDHHYDDYLNDAYLQLTLLFVFTIFKVCSTKHCQNSIVCRVLKNTIIILVPNSN